MARLTPKGKRIQVTESLEGLLSDDMVRENIQIGGRRMVYGWRENLYSDISGASLPIGELTDLREQLVKYGLPVGWECELEVEETSPLYRGTSSEQYAIWNKQTAIVNHKIRVYLRNKSLERGWSTYRYADMVAHKPDGSLNRGGREFVFAPMTPDFARATGAYGVFEESFSHYLWQGHYGENTGGHMHIPMGAFSDQQLVLFYKLIEHFADARVHVEGHPEPERAARFIQIIGARKLGGWAKWIRLNTVQQYVNLIDNEYGHRKGINTTRNYIVQKTRHNTIELRFPKGTYNAERALMRTSFLNACYNFTFGIEQQMYAGNIDAMYDIYNVDKFVEFVNTEDRWPELKRYLRRNYNGIGCVTSRDRIKTISEEVNDFRYYFIDSREHALGRRR